MCISLMTSLPHHLRLQEESPILRVGCEKVISRGPAMERVMQKLESFVGKRSFTSKTKMELLTNSHRIVTTDAKLFSDVMRTLVLFDMRAITRKAMIDLLRDRTGRYGYFHLLDDVTGEYVVVTVSPDPVIHVQMSVGDYEMNELVLLMDLPGKIDALFDEARLPEEVRGSVRERLEGKEQFDQHVLLQQGGERDRIQVRIGYVNSNGFTEYPSSDKKKKWPGTGS